MKKIKCEKCNTDIICGNYSRHVRVCNGIPPKPKNKNKKIEISKEWLLDNGNYKCPYCKNEYKPMGINYHIWKMHTDEGKNFNPNMGYVKGSRKGIGKGKHVSEATRKKLSIALKGKSHKHTQETKDKLSLKRIEYLENNDQYTLWFKVTNGKREINVQGTWEKRFAEYLNNKNIKWDRFHIKYEGHRRYTPDFYLPEYNIYIEVKGWMKDRDIDKMKRFLNDNKDCDIRLVDDIKIFNLLENNNITVIDLVKFIDKY